MPLAIELTASRTSTYGISGLAQVIGDRLMLLWQGRRTVPRHQTLLAMLDWSYDLLSEREKSCPAHAIRLLSGAFTMEMAQAVVLDLDRDGLRVANDITGLVDKSLDLRHAHGRHELISASRYGRRAYAAVKLQERGEANAVKSPGGMHSTMPGTPCGPPYQYLERSRSDGLHAARRRHPGGTRMEFFGIGRQHGRCSAGCRSGAAIPRDVDAARVPQLVFEDPTCIAGAGSAEQGWKVGTPIILGDIIQSPSQ